jgi:phosphatidylserine/phosphatidylglycerophosphate/cardiolipin synthase-like enzyme
MRKTVVQNGIIVKAYAGVTGVLLAFNFENDADRHGVLGFAIQRDDSKWLPAAIPFPGVKHNAGDDIPTNKAPVQKFRWSDYTTNPDTTYKYTVYAVHGTAPDQLALGAGAEITVTTESRDVSSVIGNPDRILTISNRAVAASQAFSREFPETTNKLNAALAKPKPAGKAAKTDGILTEPEMKWLSNGLLESIVAFIKLANGPGFALDVAIYQYELEDIWGAINAASKAGAAVRLIYHSKKGDTQTDRNEASAAALKLDQKYGRVTHAIFHHKFIILSKLEGATRTPIAVLCGSTNFTSNGVYAQANNVQVTSNPLLLKKYVDQFNFIFQQPAHDPPATAVQDTEQNILSATTPLQVGFSPRNGRSDITLFASLINSARQDVLFATAFGLDKEFTAALSGQPHDSILRYGVEDKSDTITGRHADRTADFTAASTLPSGLDGWLAEHRTPGAKGSILIHDKIVVVDFTSDNPIVINGSHNYSNAASASNDENYLIVHGNTAMADCLGVEVMRLYDHYRFRFVQNPPKSETAAATPAKPTPQKPLTLYTTDEWTNDYYDATKLKFADRMVFSGVLHGGTPPPAAPGATSQASIQQVRASNHAPGTATFAAAAKPSSAKKSAAPKKAVVKAAAKKTPSKPKSTPKKASIRKEAPSGRSPRATAKGTRGTAAPKKAVTRKTTSKKSPNKTRKR